MTSKALVIVHGMGSQRRNQALLGLVRPMRELIRMRGDPEKIPDNFDEPDGGLAFDAPAWVDVSYGDMNWRVTEYWWAEEFVPASSFNVSKWIVRRLWHHFKSLIRGFKYTGRDFFPPDPRLRDPWIALIYKAVANVLFTIAFLLLMALTPILATLLVVLSFIRWFPGVPPIIGRAQSILQTIGVDYLGDIYFYFTDAVQGAQVCGGLQHMLTEIAKKPEVTEILLYCHSTGNVIAYEALAKLYESPCKDAKDTLEKVSAFISTGSILSMAWNPKIVKHERFKKPIPPHIRWYNLWTQYDVGAAGKISSDDKHWLKDVDLHNRRVTNLDDILKDHTGYTNNDEQVVSLVLEELGGLNKSNDFWRGGQASDPGDWKTRSNQVFKDFDVRRGTVAWLAIFRLPVLLVVPVLFPLMSVYYGWAQAVGTYFQLQQIPWFWLHWFTTGLTTSGPAIIVRIGMALLISLILTAGAAGLYYIYKYVWWVHWARDVRYKRHQAFKDWRDDQSAAVEPQQESSAE